MAQNKIIHSVLCDLLESNEVILMPFIVIDTYKVNDDNILDFSSRQELLMSDTGIVSIRDQLSDTLVDMWQTADYISQVMDWWDNGHDIPLYIGDATLNELDRITYRKSG